MGQDRRWPAKYWVKDIKAYIDNKNFPTPRTPAQRKRFKQTLVTGHLRKKSEGLDRGFTKPREKHSFTGIPSVQISAAVTSDKITMWHVVSVSWNGKNAAIMYKGHLRPALQRKYGEVPYYKIIEDGNRKDNTSNKGIAARKRSKDTCGDVAAAHPVPHAARLLDLAHDREQDVGDKA